MKVVAKRIVDQRTPLERWFLQALNKVRSEAALER